MALSGIGVTSPKGLLEKKSSYNLYTGYMVTLDTKASASECRLKEPDSVMFSKHFCKVQRRPAILVCEVRFNTG